MAADDPSATAGERPPWRDPTSRREWETRRIVGTWEGLRRFRQLSEVERFLIFLGYPRSGHTLIGSLLNAHPDVVVSHELNVCRYLDHGFHRTALYGLIFERDRRFASVGRHWEQYDYRVPNQHQGSVRRLRVIGDKRGAATTRWLERQPDLLERMRGTVRVPLRAVHVIRNPYDNIATMSRRAHSSVDEAIGQYEALCDAVAAIRARLGADEIVDLRYEDFLADPRARLAELCRFAGVEPSDAYLDDCAAVVWSSSSRSRDTVEWSPTQHARLDAIIAGHHGFEGYSFEH
jgi:hypothetical protein